jgi:hypothetical protein
VLSQPDGGISEAHYKQDYHIESYRVALLEGDPLVGPNCFSYTDDWGEPLYKLCHRSDVGATVEGLPPTPSSRRSSMVAEEELIWGMDAEVEEALTVLERAMARVMKLQQQSKVRMREEYHAQLPSGGVQSWRACTHAQSGCPPMGCHQLSQRRSTCLGDLHVVGVVARGAERGKYGTQTLSAKAGMGISVVPLEQDSPRFQLPSDAPKELVEPKLTNGHGGPSDSVARSGCFGCFGGGNR